MAALEGSVVAISGGNGGAARAIADALAREGADVITNGADVDQKSVERLVDSAVERFGRLDVLVLDAADAGESGPLAELDDAGWQRVLDKNLNHVFWGIRRGLTHMLPRGEGRIIVTSSIEAKLPRAGASSYVAASHAVNGLVKSVAHEVGPSGVKVNAILAGPDNLEQVASVAVLLASPSITSITGCMFPADSGATPY
jgi:3-hydroxybutyrate dehydrogenase